MEAATAVRMEGENRWFSGVTDGGNNNEAGNQVRAAESQTNDDGII